MSYAMIPMRSASTAFGNSSLGGLGDVSNNAIAAFMQSLKNAQMLYDYQDKQTINPYYMQAAMAGLDAGAAKNAGAAAMYKRDNMAWNSMATSRDAGTAQYQQRPMAPQGPMFSQGQTLGGYVRQMQPNEDAALVPQPQYQFPNYNYDSRQEY